jgi:hypothetical protein
MIRKQDMAEGCRSMQTPYTVGGCLVFAARQVMDSLQ